jgi:hypothetical protein
MKDYFHILALIPAPLGGLKHVAALLIEGFVDRDV